MTITNANYPSPYYAKWLANNSPVKHFYGSDSTFDEIANSVMKVNIFYNKLSYDYYSDTPLLTFVGLLSNFGGYLGLFIGMSVLSMLEVIELLFIFIVEVSKKLKSRSNKLNQTPAPLTEKGESEV